MRIKFLTERPFGEKVKKWLILQGDTIVEKNPELIISCYYGKIIKDFTVPTINFHPGLLPMYRGMHPQYWALMEGGPYGVTLHWVVREVDCGPIIAQKKYKVEPTDIASDMDRKTQDAMFLLFTEWWGKIKNNKVVSREQRGPSSRHFKKDIKKIHKIDAKVIRQLRANTFDGTSYAYFMDKGKKIKVGVKFYEDTR